MVSIPSSQDESLDDDDYDLTQPCRECGQDLPLSTDYFNRDNTSPTGFQTMCRDCKQAARKHQADKAIVERVAKMEKDALALLDTNAIMENAPHAATMLEDIIACFGGSQGFAQHLMMQYLSAPSGGQQRTKILSLIVTMTQKVTEAGHAQLKTDLMTKDELESEVKRLLRVGLNKQEELDEPS